MGEMMQHSAYPHFAGSLFDCPACEAECHCKPDETLCVHCAIKGESLVIDDKTRRYISRFSA